MLIPPFHLLPLPTSFRDDINKDMLNYLLRTTVCGTAVPCSRSKCRCWERTILRIAGRNQQRTPAAYFFSLQRRAGQPSPAQPSTAQHRPAQHTGRTSSRAFLFLALSFSLAALAPVSRSSMRSRTANSVPAGSRSLQNRYLPIVAIVGVVVGVAVVVTLV